MIVTERKSTGRRVDDAVMLHAIFEHEKYRKVRDAILADTHARRGLLEFTALRPQSLRPRIS